MKSKPLKFLDHLTFRRPDGTCCRAWFAASAGDMEILFVDCGPAKATVEIAREGADGIYEAVQNYQPNNEEEKALAEAKEFVAEALKPEEPK